MAFKKKAPPFAAKGKPGDKGAKGAPPPKGNPFAKAAGMKGGKRG